MLTVDQISLCELYKAIPELLRLYHLDLSSPERDYETSGYARSCLSQVVEEVHLAISGNLFALRALTRRSRYSIPSFYIHVPVRSHHGSSSNSSDF